MFENLLLLAWYDIVLIIGLSVLICAGIILAMSIWENKEWTGIIRATKHKKVQVDEDEEGKPIFEKIAYKAIVDWGTFRSLISGLLLGIFYSVLALIGVGEIGVETDLIGEISNIWTIRIVPIILSIFVGFFSDLFWDLIKYIGSLIEQKLNEHKQKNEGLENKTEEIPQSYTVNNQPERSVTIIEKSPKESITIVKPKLTKIDPKTMSPIEEIKEPEIKEEHSVVETKEEPNERAV